MAQIILTIPDEHVSQLIDDMAANYGYQDQIEDPENPGTLIPNPVTKAVFARKILYQNLRNEMLKRRIAEENAVRDANINILTQTYATIDE